MPTSSDDLPTTAEEAAKTPTALDASAAKGELKAPTEKAGAKASTKARRSKTGGSAKKARKAVAGKRIVAFKKALTPKKIVAAKKAAAKPVTKTDVAALRARLGASRSSFAELVGVSTTSIENWEAGKQVSDKYAAKLRELETQAAAGTVPEKGSPAKKTASKAAAPAKAAPAKAAPAKATRKGATKKAKQATATPSAAGKFDVAALREKLGASRSAFGKLVGVSPGSVLNWENGKSLSEESLASLRELVKEIAAGTVAVPAPKKGGRPRNTAAKDGAAKPVKATKATRPRTARTIDVAALRARLGLSQGAFAKRLGVSAGSILNWERHGTTITKKNVKKLRALAKEAAAGVEKTVAEKGRPKTAQQPAPKPERRGPAVVFVGEVAPIYANVATISRGKHDARITLGLELAGENGARVVADVVVPLDLLASLR
jgi:DNA-binding transcriptional regulator YiaG